MADQFYEEEEFNTRFTGKIVLRILSLLRPHWTWAVGFILLIAFVSAQDSFFTYLGKLFIDQGIVDILSQNAINGALDAAPFDRIIAAAEVDKIPQSWLDQLKVGGRLVAPAHSSLVVVDKKARKDFQIKMFSYDKIGEIFIRKSKNLLEM